MRSCPKCSMKFYNGLKVCPLCNVPTVDEDGNVAPDAVVQPVPPETTGREATAATREATAVAGEAETPETVVPVQKPGKTALEERSAAAKAVFTARPVFRCETCFGTRLMNILAVLECIGGLILASVLGNAGGEFDFGIFLGVLLVSAIFGGVMYAVGELMQNVARIADALQEMKIEEK